TSTPSGARIRNWRRVFIGSGAYSEAPSRSRASVVSQSGFSLATSALSVVNNSGLALILWTPAPLAQHIAVSLWLTAHWLQILQAPPALGSRASNERERSVTVSRRLTVMCGARGATSSLQVCAFPAAAPAVVIKRLGTTEIAKEPQRNSDLK